MTGPRFSRKNHGNNHSYYLNGIKIPGVTTIIGNLSKDALIEWASKTTARYAVDNWPRLAGMTDLDRYEELRNARRNTTKEAAVRGTRIHALAEKIARGEAVDVDDQSLRNAAEAYARLLDEWELEPIGLELSCASTSYSYAGTMDGIYRSPRLGTVVADIKTGKGIYNEVGLQLAAYRYSDIYLEEQPNYGPRGGKLKSSWIERPMPAVDGAIAIHIERETDDSPAAARLLPISAGPDVWDVFLYLREIQALWTERVGWDFRNAESYSPTVGSELHPEMNDDEIRAALGLEEESFA